MVPKTTDLATEDKQSHHHFLEVIVVPWYPLKTDSNILSGSKNPKMLKSLMQNRILFAYNLHTSSHILSILSRLLIISKTM